MDERLKAGRVLGPPPPLTLFLRVWSFTSISSPKKFTLFMSPISQKPPPPKRIKKNIGLIAEAVAFKTSNFMKSFGEVEE